MSSLQLRHRLILIVILPLIALTYFSLQSLAQKQRQVEEAEHLHDHSLLTTGLSGMIHELQLERGLSCGYIGNVTDSSKAKLNQQYTKTDQKLDRLKVAFQDYRARNSALHEDHGLSGILEEIDEIGFMRSQIGLRALSCAESLSWYSHQNLMMLNSIEKLNSIYKYQTITQDMSALNELLNYKEFIGIERGMINGILSRGQFVEGIYDKLLKNAALQAYSEQAFLLYASEQTKHHFQRAMASPAMRQLDALRAQIRKSGREIDIDIDAGHWFSAMTAKMDLLKQIEDNLISEVSEQTFQINLEAQSHLKLSILLLLFTLGITGWISFRLSSDLTRNVRVVESTVEQIESSGNFSIRTSVTSNDEIGRFALAINNLLESLERAHRSKDDFLASMSHELRTPLASIIGNAELLSEEDLSHDQYEMLHPIVLSGRNLLSLVNDILDMSKIESGKFEIESFPYSLSDMIKEIELLFSIKMNSSDADFIVNQQIYPSVQIWGDRARVIQIMLNLLSNAQKFTHEGSVTLNCWLEKETLCFSVEDTGIGMSSEVLSRLFKPFEQADSSISRRFGGTGLGLHISQNLAELMEGEIEASSEEGKGSCFVLKLPYRESELPIENEPIALVKDSNNDQMLKGEVLIVEDTPELQALETRIVEKSGATVTIANNGQEAVKLATKWQFDLILMDMQMPVMNGLEATKILRQQGNKTPIIALTANVMQKHRDAFFKAGCDGFIEKPVKQDEIGNTLKLYLKVDQQKTETAETGASTIQSIQLSNSVPQKQERVDVSPVLVVDDEMTVLDVYRIALEDSVTAGEIDQSLASILGEEEPEIERQNIFDITYAQQGLQGVELAQAALERGTPFPVAFIDMRMPPGMNGLETAKALRKLDKHIFIVIVTAYSDVPLEQINSELGYDVLYLAKPFKKNEVSQLARMLTQSSKKDRELLSTEVNDSAATPGGGAENSFIDDDLMQLFKDRMDELKTEIAVALEEENWKGLSDIAHTIKGSARTFGFMEIGDHGANIQQLLGAGDHEEAVAVSHRLTEEIEALLL